MLEHSYSIGAIPDDRRYLAPHFLRRHTIAHAKFVQHSCETKMGVDGLVQVVGYDVKSAFSAIMQHYLTPGSRPTAGYMIGPTLLLKSNPEY